LLEYKRYQSMEQVRSFLIGTIKMDTIGGAHEI
jgi:hypothetical protein